MTPFDLWPVPPRSYARTDSYRMISGGSYRFICRLLSLLLVGQAITIALLLLELGRID
jgi:hypothetical protein